MSRKKIFKRKSAVIFIFVIVAFIGSSFTAYSDEISFDLPDSLKVTSLSYSVGKSKGKNRLVVELKVKNISKEDHRYRMRISLKDGTSAGMLVPRKGKPPVIKSGNEEKVKLPFIAYDQLPDGLSVAFVEFPNP